MPRDGVEFHRFNEPVELKAAEPDLCCQAIPMGRGPFEVTATTIRMGSMTLAMGRVSPFLGFLRVAADRAVLQLPCGRGEGVVLNTVACRPGLAGAYAGGSELLCATRGPSSFAALILPSGAVEELLEPPAGSKLLQRGSCALLQTRSAHRKRTERILRAARATANSVPGTFDAEQPRHALRDDLLRAAHDLVSPEAEIRTPRGTRTRRHLVVKADEYLRAHLDRPIYTEELCEALATSASCLSEAFRTVFAVSPHRFLKLRRLSMVRAALRSREGASPLVKSVALSHGFWHLGQFAHDYRETFGEMPSETLARARG
jgi:AraC family transcriptional regulator, ethanolamine operon transcriptional activator